MLLNCVLCCVFQDKSALLPSSNDAAVVYLVIYDQLQCTSCHSSPELSLPVYFHQLSFNYLMIAHPLTPTPRQVLNRICFQKTLSSAWNRLHWEKLAEMTRNWRNFRDFSRKSEEFGQQTVLFSSSHTCIRCLVSHPWTVVSRTFTHLSIYPPKAQLISSSKVYQCTISLRLHRALDTHQHTRRKYSTACDLFTKVTNPTSFHTQ